MKPSKNPDVLTLPDVAAHFGVSEWTVRKWMTHPTNPIPSIKIFGLRRFLKSEIDPWFRSLERDTGTATPTNVKPIGKVA